MAPIIKDPAHPAFPHGTTRGYSRRCRCTPCTHAHTAKTADNARQRKAGQPPRVPVEPVRAHIQALRRAGCSYQGIEKAAGLGKDCVRKIAVGPTRMWTWRIVSDAILAVRPEDVAALSVPKYPYAEGVRMLRSLQAHGWPVGQLAQMMGHQPGTGCPSILRGRPRRWCTADTYQRVQALYRAYEGRPGPSDEAREQARALGYYPPACYDDGGRLIRSAIRRDYKGTPDREVGRRFEVLRMLLAGKTYSEIADRLDANEKAADRVMRRWGLRSVYDGYETRFRPGQRHVLAVLRDAIAELDLCLVDPIEFEAEVADRVAAVRADFAARRREIKAIRAPAVPRSTARGHVIRLRRASDTSARAA